MLRAASNMPATTSSFTAFALAPGALNTGTPRADIAATGMLLVPDPARPTASRDSEMPRSCRSAERTRIACGSSTSADTANRSQGSLLSPPAEMWLTTRTRYLSVTAWFSALLCRKVGHVVHQRLDPCNRHRVVQRGPHAANRAVPLQLNKILLCRTGEEIGLQCGVGEPERNIHARPVGLLDGIEVEIGAIDEVVQQLRLCAIAFLGRREPAVL